MSFKSIAPVALVLSGLSGSASAVNLVTNGSFELVPLAGNYELLLGGDSTTITGWTTIPQGVERFSPVDYNPVLGFAHGGRLVVDLAPFTHSVGGLYQDVATSIGQSYMLDFYGATSTYAGRQSTSQIDVTIGGNAQSFTVTNNNVAIAWQSFSASFVATGTTTRIQFSNAQDGTQHFAFVDSVSLAPVPEPATMVLGAAALMAAARKRRALKA